MSADRPRETLFRRAVRQLARRKLVVVAALVLASYLIIALLGVLELLPDYQERVGGPYEAPSLTLPLILGTDIFGRSRSEEHTSELQSRGHLVCRLLLEKKKTP